MAKELTVKNVIPNLVSIFTNHKSLPGFNLSENLNFYPSKENMFKYIIENKNKIKFPKEYSFRNGYYYYNNQSWYYDRNILNIFHLKFSYNLKTKTFYFNKSYKLIPFEIGGINPVGKNISDIINLELFLHDYIVFRGCAFEFKGKTIAIIAPGFNGKTTLLKNIVLQGGKYISEDILIINFKKKIIYPSGPHYKNLFRAPNSKLKKILKNTNIIKKPQKITKLTLLLNNTMSNLNSHEKNIKDILFLNSLLFLDNKLIKAHIMQNNLASKILHKIEELNNSGLKLEKYDAHNFDFNKILK